MRSARTGDRFAGARRQTGAGGRRGARPATVPTMTLSHAGKVRLAIAALAAAAVGLVAYKVRALGYSLADVLPVRQYEVTYALDLDGHGADVRVRTFLPSSDAHQTISDERDASSGLHLSPTVDGPNRVATWTGTEVPDGATIRHTL